MSQSVALQYLVDNFKDAVPDGALTDENRNRALSILSSIFAVVSEKTSDTWAAISKEMGDGYAVVIEELRPNLERPATKSRLDFCSDNTEEIDRFMQVFNASGPERKPEIVYLTGELPVPGPANTL